MTDLTVTGKYVLVSVCQDCQGVIPLYVHSSLVGAFTARRTHELETGHKIDLYRYQVDGKGEPAHVS